MNYTSDYRVNQKSNGEIISIEVTCCGQKIGEVRYNDGSSIKCPECKSKHTITVHHNHFHLTKGTEE